MDERGDRTAPGCAPPWAGGRPDSAAGWPMTWAASRRARRRQRWQARWHGDWQRGGPLRRQQSGRIAGGVAAGISARTGMSVTTVRLIFVISALISGFGAAAYVLIWLFVPAVGQDSAIVTKALSDRRGIALAAVAASVLALLLLISSVLGIGWFSSLSWPPVIAVAGFVLVVRNAPPEEQETLRRLIEPLTGDSSGSGHAGTRLRMLIAGALFVAGLITLLTGHANRMLLRPLGGLVLLVAAAVVLLGPWWLRTLRDLMEERQARVRAEERAEMASRVHDSVLQTLALIQRRADDPQQVVQLARAQERELRSWLFDGRAPGSMDGLATTLAGGVRLIQQDVEAQHGVVVEAVTVGDCPLDDDLAALLAAAREATVNAAKWSGARTVSIFAEVEPAAVSVFVRDRGRGFDPDAVPADRKGLAESIRARMARRGGTAAIRSAPGEGAEVSLTMPRHSDQREPSQAT